MTRQNSSEPDWDDALRGLIEQTPSPAAAPGGGPTGADGLAPADPAGPTGPSGDGPAAEAPAAPTVEDLLLERTADLQRLQAEYLNYKKRVDRDRAVARQGGIEAVLGDLLPVLDGIEAARSHDELTGGAKLLADELAKATAKYGLESFGQADEPFDPHIHDALMTLDKPGYPVTSVAQVFQLGYKVKDRILRPARVAVAAASEEAVAESDVASAGPQGATGSAPGESALGQAEVPTGAGADAQSEVGPAGPVAGETPAPGDAPA